MRRTEEAEDLTQHMVSTALIKRRCGCIKLNIVLIKSGDTQTVLGLYEILKKWGIQPTINTDLDQ